MADVRAIALVITLTGCASTPDNLVDDAAADAVVADDADIDARVDAGAATCVPDCGAHATCESGVCTCDEGFQGDGFSCHRYWERVASYLFDIAPLPFSDFSPGQWPVVVGHQRSIFIGVQSHMTLTYPGWRSIDLTAVPPTLSPPLALPPNHGTNSNALCTCGYDERLSSDGARYIYMFGSIDQRYDVTIDQWVSHAPTYGLVRRGSSPELFVPTGETVLHFGGVDSSGTLDTILRYSISSNSFAIEPTPMPAPLTNAVAWLPSGGPTIYVAGGQHDRESNSTMPHNGIISRPTTSNVWTTHPDAPGDLRYPVGMGDYEGRIWVAARNFVFMPTGVESLPSKAYFFNPDRNLWDRTIFIPTGTVAAVTASGATWALARTENGGVGGFDLYKLVSLEDAPP